MQTFYFIRHGETDWNRQELMQGHTDIPLNATGVAQAEQIRDLALALGIEAVVSSDLQRAVKTAELIFPHLKSQVDARLREVHLGEAEGLHRMELAFRFGTELVNRWVSHRADAMTAKFPGGETREEALCRLEACLDDWLERHAGQRVAFVAHGMLIRLFSQRLLGFYRDGLRAPNCSVYEFARTSERTRLIQIYHACDLN